MAVFRRRSRRQQSAFLRPIVVSAKDSSIALALASGDALLASRRREVEEFTCTLQSVVIPQNFRRDPIRKVPRWRATRNVEGNLRSRPGARA